MDDKIIEIFRNFFIKKQTLDYDQKILKKYRNIIIWDYDLKISRYLWMSLLLYKYKDEMNVNEILWNQARKIIITILKRLNKNELDLVVHEYIKLFEVWKKNDILSFMFEVAGIYYNIEQIKKSYEDANDASNELLNKIREKCIAIKTDKLLDEILESIEQKVIKEKYLIVKDILDKAYWDNLIVNDDYSLVYDNLRELKMLIVDILPKRDKNNELFDVENIQLDINFIIDLFINTINILKDNDSLDAEQKYNSELELVDKIVEENSLDKIIAILLRKLMILTIDLKNRKEIWSRLLSI